MMNFVAFKFKHLLLFLPMKKVNALYKVYEVDGGWYYNEVQKKKKKNVMYLKWYYYDTKQLRQILESNVNLTFIPIHAHSDLKHQSLLNSLPFSSKVQRMKQTQSVFIMKSAYNNNNNGFEITYKPFFLYEPQTKAGIFAWRKLKSLMKKLTYCVDRQLKIMDITKII